MGGTRLDQRWAVGMPRIDMQAEAFAGGRHELRGFVLGVVMAVAGVLMPLGGVSVAGASEMVTETFKYTGTEQTFTVPAGVSSVQVLAVGESGGSTAGYFPIVASAAGGAAAQVTSDLSVTPGEALYVEVGGGGFDGGGAGGGGGALGGDASDVRASPRAAGLSPDTRLLVAGGGGGAGVMELLGYFDCVGGTGGAAGAGGGSSTVVDEGTCG